jgi:hypothetical protein
MQPLIRQFHLPPVPNLLVEDSKLVPNAVPNCGDFERCQGVEKTRGKSSESTVAETGLWTDQELRGKVPHDFDVFLEVRFYGVYPSV